MASRGQIRGPLIAAAIGVCVVAVYAVGVGTRLGWLGVGLVGLILLLICVRLDLHGGRAVPGMHVDKSEIDRFARQFDKEAAGTHDDQADRRARAIYIGRGVGVLLAVLGFGMFFLQLDAG